MKEKSEFGNKDRDGVEKFQLKACKTEMICRRCTVTQSCLKPLVFELRYTFWKENLEYLCASEFPSWSFRKLGAPRAVTAEDAGSLTAAASGASPHTAT